MTEVGEHSELPPSSADKWFYCHAWRRLVHGVPDTPSAAAEEGTLAHDWLANHLLGIRDLSELGDKIMYDHLMPVAEWVGDQPGELHVETQVDFGSAFGYTGLTGTSDAILVHPKHLTIGDLKYGRVFVDVNDNLQLKAYLVGAVAKFGRRPRYRLVIMQPRAWDEEKPGTIRETWISDEELQVFEAELDLAIAANYNPRSKPKVGEYCRHYCKALGRCPAAAEHSLNLLRMYEEEE
jgi:hypothetical protein